MNLKSIKLDNKTYDDYLHGKEVRCAATQLTSKNLHEGEHILVYKDTVANNTNSAVPKREMQSEYIGIEGVVTKVLGSSEHHEGVVIRKT
jgi:hypothetical protein